MINHINNEIIINIFKIINHNETLANFTYKIHDEKNPYTLIDDSDDDNFELKHNEEYERLNIQKENELLSKQIEDVDDLIFGRYTYTKIKKI